MIKTTAEILRDRIIAEIMIRNKRQLHFLQQVVRKSEIFEDLCINKGEIRKIK